MNSIPICEPLQARSSLQYLKPSIEGLRVEEDWGEAKEIGRVTSWGGRLKRTL